MLNRITILYCVLMIVLFFTNWAQAQNEGQRIFLDSNDVIRYTTDDNDNHLMNFCYAGYPASRPDIFELSNKVFLTHRFGDQRQYLQSIIDSLEGVSPDSLGLRGVITLGAGSWEISGPLYVEQGGIGIEGADLNGFGDPLAEIIMSPPVNTTFEVILFESEGLWRDTLVNKGVNILGSFIPAGSRSLKVQNLDDVQVGDEVVVSQESNDWWLEQVDYGGTAGDPGWNEGEINLLYRRKISRIDSIENKIIIDIPIFDHLYPSNTRCRITGIDAEKFIQNIGLRNISIRVDFPQDTIQETVRNIVRTQGVDGGYFENVRTSDFAFAGFFFSNTRYVTVVHCSAVETNGPIQGGWRYNYCVSSASSEILFDSCYASEGRHSFVSNGTSTASNIVFKDCTSNSDFSSSEGHRRWSQGLLYEHITFENPKVNNLIGLYNRGSFGTSHGWSSVHCVVWNTQLPSGRSILLQKPPGRQNYAIGCGPIITNMHSFVHPKGYVALKDSIPTIVSLYQFQKEALERQGPCLDMPASLEGLIMKDSIKLTWTDIASGDSLIHVQLRVDRGQWKEVTAVASSADSVIIPIRNFIELGIRIYVSGNACPSPYSRELYIIPTSILSESPVKCEINVDLHTRRISGMEDWNDYDVFCFDLMGRRIGVSRDQYHIEFADRVGGWFVIIFEHKETGQVCGAKVFVP